VWICGVTIEEIVPRWMKEQGVTSGWLTPEFSYLTQMQKPRSAVSSRLEKRFVDIRSGGMLISAVTAIGKPAAKLSASLARRRMIVCRDGQCYSCSRDEGEIINV